uniref:LIM and senescent cell antigen like domains 2 n=1 Tax=Mus musculus TaxID=10090 RepID=A0A286YD07_MOUSE
MTGRLDSPGPLKQGCVPRPALPACCPVLTFSFSSYAL